MRAMFLYSSRLRKLLLAAAVLAGSGYASYHICRSAAFVQRRKRLVQILSMLGFCCETVSQSAESLSILSGDLKSFLLSDDDTVPRSLKQAFKIGQSEEFQEAVTVLSAALARGLRRGINGKPRKEGLVHGLGHGQFVKQGWQGNDADLESGEVACREIREVSFTTKGQDQPRMHGLKECMSRSRAEKKGGYDCQDWEVNSNSYGSDMHAQRSQKIGIVFDRIRKPKTSDDLLEKLVSKLFSEPGVGFTSAVTGTFARSLVLAFFDVSRNQTSSSKIPGSLSSKNHQHTSQADKGSVPTYAKIVDVLHSDPCKSLVAECMRTFISTAVTVYVDKTKDVNFCDEVVASITNPSHKDSMKEMLTIVCNGAIETLVRTSYDVLRDGQGEVTEGHEQAATSKWDIRQRSSTMAINGQLPCSTEADQEEGENSQRGALTTYKQSDSQSSSCTITMGPSQGKNVGGGQSFIEGVSKTLAIPSNHKLVVDMAGTMTSEAVRSFVNVVVSTASSQINSKLHESWGILTDYISNHRTLQLQERSRDMAAKAFVFASICLAICLHVLTGSQLLHT